MSEINNCVECGSQAEKEELYITASQTEYRVACVDIDCENLANSYDSMDEAISLWNEENP